MAIAYSEIARVLDGARRRQGWVVLATALGWGTAGALVAVLAGVSALGAGWARVPARQATLAAAAIAIVTALAWAAVSLMRRASSPVAVARTLGNAAPELRSDLVSSVELEDDYEELQESRRFSVALVDAHIARTAVRARGIDLSRVISSRPARTALLAAGAAAGLHLVFFAVSPRAMASGWQRLVGAGPVAPARRAEPITGDVELTYVYPAYMGRPPRTISGTAGEVNAPKGTEVRLVTRADRPVESAEIAFEMGSAGGTSTPPAPEVERGKRPQGADPGSRSVHPERSAAESKGEGGAARDAARSVRPSTAGPERGASGAHSGPSAQDERTDKSAQDERNGARDERNGGGSAQDERNPASNPREHAPPSVHPERSAAESKGEGGTVHPSTAGPEIGAKGARSGPSAQDERNGGRSAQDERNGGPQGANPGNRSVHPERSAAESKGEGNAVKIYQLSVKNGRDLSGSFVVEEGGSYRFRFTKGKKVVAEGPAVPIVVEADAFPEVRITAPADEVEVGADALVNVEWTASDDVGLRELTLVVKPPGADEKRTPVRGFDSTRRESGSYSLALPPYRLAEGERLLYWLEVTDGDTVSGPKRAASSTHTVKIYSEEEHHRAALARAQQLWDEMVRLLGDRLELLEGQQRWTPERLLQAQALDARTRALHEGMRDAAAALRKEKNAPKELPLALTNVASGVRQLEQVLTAIRRQLATSRALLEARSSGLTASVARYDAQLDAELEKDVLYLEELFDKRRAEDLVRMGKDLAQRRRDLASLLEKYKDAPDEAKKKELLAEVSRMKSRMREMMKRMAELAKSIGDEHMNQEALAELSKSQDALGGLDDVEKKLAAGDIEGAMKALDQLGNQMQQMLASLERTAGRPDAKNAELMKEMMAFKKDLEEVQAQQEKVAGETEAVKQAYQKKVAERLKEAEAKAKKLEGLAEEAQREVARAENGVSLRTEEEFSHARDRLGDLKKALQGKDFDAALESVRRAMPSMKRLAASLGDEAEMTERYPALGSKPPRDVRDAQRHASAAVPPAQKVQEELEKLFPDPKSVLGQKEQQRLGELQGQQGALQKKAGGLRKKLDELAQRAPVFPPQARDMLAGSEGHMGRAEAELGQKNPQRGHGEQRQAMDDLSRFKKGLDEMAKNSKGGQGGGGFPFPFGDDPGSREGDGTDPSQEKVEIPGAEAYKAPEEFRKDLLEAMKQGAPEPYKSDLQRYYEELVK